MKYSFGISDFLEEISSLSHSVVFLYFFALIAEKGFLSSSCYSLELCIQVKVIQLYPTLSEPMDCIVHRLNSPGQNTGVGSLSLLLGIFPTQESNWVLLQCRRILYQLSYQGSPGTKWRAHLDVISEGPVQGPPQQGHWPGG